MFLRLALVIAFSSLIVLAQGPPHLVLDLAPGADIGQTGDPRDAVAIGPVALFSALGRELGRELWRTDGTAAGTWLVRDVQPAWPDGVILGSLIRLDGVVLFHSSGASSGDWQLWRSDGTPAGTIQLTEVRNVHWPSGLTVCGHQAFFLANQFASSTGFWRTDGTPGGTWKVMDLGYFPGGLASLTGAAFDERLVFAGSDAEHGVEPWVSDGTPGGTHLLADLTPGPSGSTPVSFVRSGPRVFFWTGRGQTWVTDLTAAGTRLVSGRVCGRMAPVAGGVVILQVSGVGLELWWSDGTDPGTVRIASWPSRSGNPPLPLVAGGLVYFRVDTSLWRTDGTAAGTIQLHTAAGALQAVPDGIVFNGTDAAHGSELWRSDGSVVGTRLCADLRPGPDGSRATPLGLRDGTCLVNASEPEHGSELWSYDLASGLTVLVRDLWPALPDSSRPGLAAADLTSQAWFNAGSYQSGAATWRSDGTSEGTSRAIAPGPGGSGGIAYTPLGDAMLFFTPDEHSVWRLWRSALGSQRAEALAEVTPDVQQERMVEAGGQLFFAATGPGAWDMELWRTDGTAAGTALVVDLLPGPYGSEPREITALGSEVLFTAQTLMGRTLWISDGTAAGTRPLVPAPGYFSPSGLARVGDLVLFIASDPLRSTLWRTDGTAAGTWPVGPIETDVNVGTFVATPERLFLGAGRYGRGAQLWVKDDVAAPARLVADLGSAPQLLTALGRDVVFFCDDGVHGLEPWRSDGTEAGTFLLRDIQPGLAGSAGQPGTSSWFLYCPPGADRALFGADDGIHGLELWRTDGTRAGTRLFADLFPGPWPSLPSRPVLAGGQLLFSAADPVHGREPWAMSAMAMAMPEGNGCAGTNGRVPRIRSRGTPHLGRMDFAVTLEGGRPLATAVLVLARSPAVALLPGGCLGLVQDAIAVFATRTDAAGGVELPLPIPPDDGLEGRVAYAQWVVLDPAGALDQRAALSERLQIVVR